MTQHRMQTYECVKLKTAQSTVESVSENKTQSDSINQ